MRGRFRHILEGENEEEEDDNIDFAQYNSFADTLMGDVDDEDGTDGLAQMLHDAKEDCDNERDWKKLEQVASGGQQIAHNEAKDVVCPLGLEKIHACPNDCILYHCDYKDLESCPMIKASRYKIKSDNTGTLRANHQGRECLLRNKKHAKVIQRHKEERKQDDMLRHPADGSQWRKIDRTYPELQRTQKT
ncbi:LOW QUALITY PROTEIN: hypothetical protein U9M48_008299 [Paspalum notatum var. saurae]|uniref:Uncharacterized protein n=1 Tax=Paspalum notatum var. saurae TaxID=547442 RepID=A0AAQ3SNQ7_PASNO